jgi:hypothetical protein
MGLGETIAVFFIIVIVGSFMAAAIETYLKERKDGRKW